MAKVGLEPTDESPANFNESPSQEKLVVHDPVQSAKTDQLAAFVASLTPEQGSQLAELLAQKPKE